MLFPNGIVTIVNIHLVVFLFFKEDEPDSHGHPSGSGHIVEHFTGVGIKVRHSPVCCSMYFLFVMFFLYIS